MRAAVQKRYGPPEVVRIAEVPRPVPADDELLVRVHVTTVNRTDCGFRAGHPWIVRFFAGLTTPRSPVNGSEFAGVVEAAGSAVTRFEVGDGVFGFREELGAHAEYLTIAAEGAVATIPDGVTFEQAAASTEGAHYALTDIRRAKIGDGQRVLVNGGTGAIGSAAIQLLKGLGANVTAVCATEHLELVRGLGADRVIDYTAEDFTKDEQRYDVVFDAVGKSSFGRCKPLLKPRGIYLSTDLGPLSMNPILALVTPPFGGRKVLFPLPPKHDRAVVEHFRALLEDGTFRPLIDRHYPMSEIVEAYRYVETGRKVGNVLIDVV